MHAIYLVCIVLLVAGCQSVAVTRDGGSPLPPLSTPLASQSQTIEPVVAQPPTPQTITQSTVEPVFTPTLSSVQQLDATDAAAMTLGIYPTQSYPSPTPTLAHASLESDPFAPVMLIRVRTSSDEWPDAYLTAAANDWEFTNTTLNHRLLPGCQLEFWRTLLQASGPIDRTFEDIGNTRIEVVTSPADQEIVYNFPYQHHMSMHYTADVTDPAYTQCREAVEAVIATYMIAE